MTIVKMTDPTVRQIVHAAFPSYSGKTANVERDRRGALLGYLLGRRLSP